MKNPENTNFNKKLISGMTVAEFCKKWKDAEFSGDAKEWYTKITGKKKAE